MLVTQSRASTMFSLCQVTFTIGRFVGVVILNWVDPALLLSFYAIMCVISSICVATLSGWTAVGFLYVLFFFESICYPVSGLNFGLKEKMTYWMVLGSAFSRLVQRILACTRSVDLVSSSW